MLDIPRKDDIVLNANELHLHLETGLQLDCCFGNV